jgi:hypothetical protein
MRDLRAEGGDEAILVDLLGAHMRVEVAIGAFGEAEGPVNIDPEAGIAMSLGVR